MRVERNPETNLGFQDLTTFFQQDGAGVGTDFEPDGKIQAAVAKAKDRVLKGEGTGKGKWNVDFSGASWLNPQSSNFMDFRGFVTLQLSATCE